MDEKDFTNAVRLIKQFSGVQLFQAKQSLFSMITDMENEKKNISNEVRRSVQYFHLSSRAKEKRIKYLDEIILPNNNSTMTSEASDVFPELRITSLQKIRAFKRERERLSKTKQSYVLRVRQNAKLLSVAYTETDKLEKRYEEINKAEITRRFFENRNIPVAGIIEADIKRYYEVFRKEGL